MAGNTVDIKQKDTGVIDLLNPWVSCDATDLKAAGVYLYLGIVEPLKHWRQDPKQAASRLHAQHLRGLAKLLCSVISLM